jgi:predicted amidohydrolase YtcJ
MLERLNREVALAPLHWTIAHLDDASEASLKRMKALGIGWTLQDQPYFSGDRLPAGSTGNLPLIVTAMRLGVAVGAGTDAHRVMSYNPFTALQWMLDGRTVSGRQTRFVPEIPSRTEALRLYTLGSAWVSHDEAKRGSLAPGKLADLAVLSADYLTMPVGEIGRLESVLTVVGGRIVYAGAPYVGLDPQAAGSR